ncbi:MAG: sigma-54 dependent transcriptional regulator [Alphaproteobacteria bacterium]|nr:sigma-54 dependent transcriptional regulator [Alphaproteobacteria bacterium]
MRLLIIGKLNGQLGAASKIARDRGAKVTNVDDVDTALDHLRAGRGADLVMIDVECDIRRFIESLENERIFTPVVACGIEADSRKAVEAIKAGAKEYIPLPPDEELISAVLEAITEESHSLIYSSPQMQQVVSMAEKIAPSDASVLITGESGTGKEVIARHIHRKSKRNNGNFISVNCAAIPENLLESELFGHEKGAFTGAATRRIGKFEEANNGTLLLDEISEMDARLQAKLLRAIQEKEIDRVGGSKPVQVNIRILATSNRDLQKEVAKGTFREDLFFRLNVISLMLPPLRDRVEEIKPLAEMFIAKYSKANGMPPRSMSDAALEKLQSHSWSGNVRELENICHRAVLMASGNKIDADAIILPSITGGFSPRPVMAATEEPPAATRASDAPEVAKTTSEEASQPSTASAQKNLIGRTVASVEKELIIETLDHCLGNRTHAANILGISIRTLRNKIKLYSEDGTEITPPTHEEAGN